MPGSTQIYDDDDDPVQMKAAANWRPYVGALNPGEEIHSLMRAAVLA